MSYRDDSITNQRVEWYRIERPDGRQSRRVFGSRIRAAELAMKAAKADDWRKLAERGVRIVAA